MAGETAGSVDERQEAAYTKVTWRLIPFLFLCFVVAYLDRVNVGFAKLQMASELHFSETVYGFGSGVFFLGYFLFEVPSNIILHKAGARVWIARIMITWGIISGLTMFITQPWHFYTLRFLLGVAEAGFFPGIILYLTFWYPAARRGRWTAAFMTAVPISGVVGGPLSGWLLKACAGMAGLAGWQWLLVIEAVPSVLLGIAVLLYLDNGIREAKWLTEEEKQILEVNIAADSKEKVEAHPTAVFRDPRIWWMSGIYFSLVMGLYGVTFWLPTIIRGIPIADPFQIGMYSAIPYLCAAVAMVFVARSSDRTRQRRSHVAVPAVLGAIGLLASTMANQNIVFAIFALAIGTSGIISALPNFWSLPTSFLGGAAAAAGIAIINSFGNLAGFVAPYLIGWVKDRTHSTDIGMWVLSGSLLVGAILVRSVPGELVDK